MSDEKLITRVLDILTVGAPESLSPEEASEALKLRAVLGKNVIGMGIAEKVSKNKPTGRLALCFYVIRKVALRKLKASEAVPPALHPALSGNRAIATDVVALGRFRLDSSTKIQPGISIGHNKIGTGTLGAIVERDGRFELLSNSHVLARSGKAKRKDLILSPGEDDGGQEPEDVVARLNRFKKFVTGGAFVNTVDCATALPTLERLGDLDPTIPGIGIPRGITNAERGMKIVKVGRSSGKTVGVVKDIHFRFVIKYDGVGNVGFLDQVLCTRYSLPGDSGSLVLDSKSKRAVGLHFASAPQGSVFNPIRQVLGSLSVTLVTKPIG